eukprot:Rmarinus@m.17378
MDLAPVIRTLAGSSSFVAAVCGLHFVQIDSLFMILWVVSRDLEGTNTWPVVCLICFQFADVFYFIFFSKEVRSLRCDPTSKQGIYLPQTLHRFIVDPLVLHFASYDRNI